jgi:hypothetical protein
MFLAGRLCYKEMVMLNGTENTEVAPSISPLIISNAVPGKTALDHAVKITHAKLIYEAFSYGSYLCIALSLSLLFYFHHREHLLPGKLDPLTELWSAIKAPGALISHEKECSPPALAGPNLTATSKDPVAPPGTSSFSKNEYTKPVIECKVDRIAERLHPVQDAPNAAAKSFMVASLAMLWFSTFAVIRRHDDWMDSIHHAKMEATETDWWRPSPFIFKCIIIFLSVVPAALFALAMAGTYEPAVFVMALAAIYVAAEHYCGLEKAKDELEEGVKGLDRQVNELGTHVGTLLNADGMNIWRAHLYSEYRTAQERIDAVVRYFDIDREWWQCHGATDPWAEYVGLINSEESLLLSVLAAKECRATVQFVADLPMAMTTETLSYRKEHDKSFMANYFRDLLGLAWQLAVFSAVQQLRHDRSSPSPGEFRYLRIKISSAPSWMHVIDDKTYQVIERQDLSQATVRALHRDSPSPSSKNRLSQWARHNVRHFAFRGTLGQEHLLSILRSAALIGEDDDHPLNTTTLDPILCSLGMQAYLKSNDQRDFVIVNSESRGKNLDPAFLPTSNIARKMCVATFDAFLRQTFPGKQTILVRDLAGVLI